MTRRFHFISKILTTIGILLLLVASFAFFHYPASAATTCKSLQGNTFLIDGDGIYSGSLANYLKTTCKIDEKNITNITEANSRFYFRDSKDAKMMKNHITNLVKNNKKKKQDPKYDYIIISAGTYDFRNYTSYSNTYKKISNYLTTVKEKWPKSKILFVIPPKSDYTKNKKYKAEEAKQRSTQEKKFWDGVINTCINNSIPYLDLSNKKLSSTYSNNGTTPNNKMKTVVNKAIVNEAATNLPQAQYSVIFDAGTDGKIASFVNSKNKSTSIKEVLVANNDSVTAPKLVFKNSNYVLKCWTTVNPDTKTVGSSTKKIKKENWCNTKYALSASKKIKADTTVYAVYEDKRGDIPDIIKSVVDASDTSNPSTDDEGNGVTSTIQGILNRLIAVVGIIAVIFIVVGGVQYMTSAGDTNKVEKAKKTILYAGIGLVICALSFAIVNWVIVVLIGGA